MEREERLLRALSDVEDRYIEEALNAKKYNDSTVLHSFTRVLPVLAACVLAVVILIRQKTPEPEMVTNPITEYASLKEAEETAGFTLTVPEFTQDETYLYYETGILEVQVTENDNRLYTIRKALGSEDISGIYETYDNEIIKDINGTSVTLKGSSEGYSLAVWESAGYSYSFYAETPLTEEEMISYVTEIQ